MINKQQNVCVSVWEGNMLGNAMKKTKAKYKSIEWWCGRCYFWFIPAGTTVKWETQVSKDLRGKHSSNDVPTNKCKGAEAGKPWSIWQRARRSVWLEQKIWWRLVGDKVRKHTERPGHQSPMPQPVQMFPYISMNKIQTPWSGNRGSPLPIFFFFTFSNFTFIAP